MVEKTHLGSPLPIAVLKPRYRQEGPCEFENHFSSPVQGVAAKPRKDCGLEKLTAP